ncbi:S41 family peptidase [Dokdonella sp.]|uniref:S41 family peptidase n=1 Tax=Dokdonella sp. TaxID=2291710 RepID=UPI0027B8E483|nr:S41 family peptidase [Dokdonella sp.]
MRLLPALAPLLALTCTLAFAQAPGGQPAPPAAPATPGAATPTPPRHRVDLADIRMFTAVYSLIQQAYVDEVDDQRLMRAAIHGLLANLDPHSEYLDKEALEGLNEDTSGSYGGLGLEVIQIDGSLRVVAPIDDTPAQRGGIRAGDIIVSIDGKPVQADDLDEAVKRLRGAPGTAVTLGVLHEKQTAPVDIELVREAIHVTSVRGRLLEAGFAYLRISAFQDETGVQLRKQIERLVADNKAALRGAVLDLRSNPGGLVTAAVATADDFLDGGVIVTTRGRIPQADTSFSATPGDLLGGAPLVVLVDNGTASAAEIVAGALKDNHRALLMGRRTFGKGSVQTVLPIDAEHAVKLTTARYYTPSGASIQAEGIQPDITLADLSLSARDGERAVSFGERDLRNHLKGSAEGDAEPAATAPAAAGVRRDYALNEALNVLKALALRPPAATPAAVPARN